MYTVHIDWEIVDKLLESGCSGMEISGYLGCTENTIYDRCKKDKGREFGEYKALKRSSGYSKLRTAQLDKALSGDTTMQIWLGKNWLSQTDRQQIQQDTTIKVEWEFEDDTKTTEAIQDTD